MFWRALEAAAKERGCPVNALVAEIDVARLDARQPPNLTSAIRQWLFARTSGSPA
jgi:predicted DNA-binding ribbon-helix-helix protein